MTQVIFVGNREVRAWRPLVDRLMKGLTFASPMLFTMDDVFTELEAARMQLWLFGDEDEEPTLFAITRIENYPRGKICVVYILAGRRIKQVIDWLPKFEAWTKMMDCDYIHFLCNERLLRLMKRFGYVATAYAVFKPLHLAH